MDRKFIFLEPEIRVRVQKKRGRKPKKLGEEKEDEEAAKAKWQVT